MEESRTVRIKKDKSPSGQRSTGRPRKCWQKTIPQAIKCGSKRNDEEQALACLHQKTGRTVKKNII